MTNREWLNLDQTPEELAALYGARDYYAYLRSPQFRRQLHRLVGGECVRLCPPGGRVLDAGCGEAQLRGYVPAGLRYVGFDGSASAVERALRAWRPDADVRVGRIEDPPCDVGPCDVVVFGGLLEVLVRPERRVDFVNLYRDRFGAPRHFVVSDLSRLDTSALEAAHRLLSCRVVEITGIDLEPPAKLSRKVLSFEYLYPS